MDLPFPDAVFDRSEPLTCGGRRHWYYRDELPAAPLSGDGRRAASFSWMRWIIAILAFLGLGGWAAWGEYRASYSAGGGYATDLRSGGGVSSQPPAAGGTNHSREILVKFLRGPANNRLTRQEQADAKAAVEKDGER